MRTGGIPNPVNPLQLGCSECIWQPLRVTYLQASSPILRISLPGSKRKHIPHCLGLSGHRILSQRKSHGSRNPFRSSLFPPHPLTVQSAASPKKRPHGRSKITVIILTCRRRRRRRRMAIGSLGAGVRLHRRFRQVDSRLVQPATARSVPWWCTVHSRTASDCGIIHADIIIMRYLLVADMARTLSRLATRLRSGPAVTSPRG
ncbi:hypothetical protein BGZ61DRAFT_103277 [Ilyonectria robusta]|uniref:uncharacterized protein n=1 Tax=Ilyonectria robusta TaxID=1079257 RepID=UPI001E8EEC98|nr:uncharacterized protein BGZ61DRAFT_103277 [Ilyonectria robusta]KAH8673098.1 hypothetical protein BGZ61DRAFT_103277 [Ilyonectria robusta]